MLYKFNPWSRKEELLVIKDRGSQTWTHYVFLTYRNKVFWFQSQRLEKLEKKYKYIHIMVVKQCCVKQSGSCYRWKIRTGSNCRYMYMTVYMQCIHARGSTNFGQKNKCFVSQIRRISKIIIASNFFIANERK